MPMRPKYLRSRAARMVRAVLWWPCWVARLKAVKPSSLRASISTAPATARWRMVSLSPRAAASHNLCCKTRLWLSWMVIFFILPVTGIYYEKTIPLSNFSGGFRVTLYNGAQIADHGFDQVRIVAFGHDANHGFRPRGPHQQ